MAVASDGGEAGRLAAIVRGAPHLMAALEAAREVDVLGRGGGDVP
jgi:hypothetical protein